MIVLSRVVGTHTEPARSGSRSPNQNNNINFDDTVTIATCPPGASYLIGSLVITLATGSGNFDDTIELSTDYTFMGGTYVYIHRYEWFAGYTIFLDGTNVRLRRRVRTTFDAPSSGTTFFTQRGFTITYKLRAVRFL